MKYKCPECGNTEEPKTISYFEPRIYQCLECGKKGNKSDFIEKTDPRFTSLPPPPPR